MVDVAFTFYLTYAVQPLETGRIILETIPPGVPPTSLPPLSRQLRVTTVTKSTYQ